MLDLLDLLDSVPGHRQTRQVRSEVRRGLVVLALACAAFAGGAQAQGFKFSNPDPSENKAQEAEQKAKVQAMLDTPCRDKIKNQKIMVLIAESRNGAVLATQNAYGPHFESINARLRELGLKTYTQAEIRGAGSAGGDRRGVQEQPGRRHQRLQAPGGAVPPARLDQQPCQPQRGG